MRALRRKPAEKEIPELLQRPWPSLREEATQDERERYQYKLFEEEPAADPSKA